MTIPDMAAEHLAIEAATIKNNEAFQKAMSTMRNEALEGLARTPATDAEAIRDHQATVRVVDELRSALDAYIRRGQPRKAPGIV